MPSLAVRDVVVRFGGVAALDGATLEVGGGSVTGLLGPNGAGKSTLFDVVTGLRRADAGQVLLDGARLDALPTHARARRGIARTFQRLELFWSLSVGDNVRVAAELARDADPRATAARLLARLGLRELAGAPVTTLSTGSARLVELARALATSPAVLLLDEPASGCDAAELATLTAILGDLAGEGLAVLLVEHDVDLVMRACARVHVLDAGRVIASGTPAAVQANPAVQAAYLGAVA